MSIKIKLSSNPTQYQDPKVMEHNIALKLSKLTFVCSKILKNPEIIFRSSIH